MTIAHRILSRVVSALVFVLFTQGVFSDTPPTTSPEATLIADYRFNGDGRDSSGHSQEIVLRNTRVVKDTLYLDGRYENAGEGYRAVATIPELEYSYFTVSMEFLPTDPAERANVFTRMVRLSIGNESNILTAGTSFRWLSIERNNDESLVVSLNNNDWSHHFTNAFVNVGEWNQIVCSVNLGASVVQTYLNNRKLETILLPPGFSLRVLESDKFDEERELTLTNYGHGGTFRGYVDNLRVYSMCLDATAALALMPEHPPGVRMRPDLTKWVTYGVVCLGLGVVIFTVLRRKEQDVGTVQ